MNKISKAGLALARFVADEYSAAPGVKAIMIGGSVSRGCADAYSDIEINVFWESPPSQEGRKQIISRLGDLWTIDRDGALMEHIGLLNAKIGGQTFEGLAMISMHHFTAREVEQWLTDVLEGFDTSVDKQSLFYAIAHGVALQGDGLIDRWKQRLAAYPPGLAGRIIAENLTLGPWFCSGTYIDRDDPLVLAQHLVWTVQSLLKVLMAVNRMYQPSTEFKWMDRTIAELPIAPANLAALIRTVLTNPPAMAMETLLGLIRKVWDLVEAHFPEVETMILDHPQGAIRAARNRWESHKYTLMPAIAAI